MLKDCAERRAARTKPASKRTVSHGIPHERSFSSLVFHTVATPLYQLGMRACRSSAFSCRPSRDDFGANLTGLGDGVQIAKLQSSMLRLKEEAMGATRKVAELERAAKAQREAMRKERLASHADYSDLQVRLNYSDLQARAAQHPRSSWVLRGCPSTHEQASQQAYGVANSMNTHYSRSHGA